MSFDEHSADYSQKITEALTVVGLEHSFFFAAKVREILAAQRRVTADGEPRVLEIGCGVGMLTERLRPQLRAVWGSIPRSPASGRPRRRTAGWPPPTVSALHSPTRASTS